MKIIKLFYDVCALRSIFTLFDDDSGKVISNRGLKYLEENSKDHNIYIDLSE